jgi:hypothetical protein
LTSLTVRFITVACRETNKILFDSRKRGSGRGNLQSVTGTKLSIQPLTTWRGEDYGYRYIGAADVLLALGIVEEGWIPGRPGRNRFSITLGSGDHRVVIRRSGRHRLEVRKYHPRIFRGRGSAARNPVSERTTPPQLKIVSSRADTKDFGVLARSSLPSIRVLRLVRPTDSP